MNNEPVPELTPQIAAELLDLEQSFEYAAAIVARGREEFDSDPILQLAAEAVSNRMGEAVGRLDSDWRNAQPDVPWRAIRDNRNFIVHVYQLIDYQQLWNTIATDVPGVRKQLESVINQARELIATITEQEGLSAPEQDHRVGD